jgi:hypothetical protein
VVEHVKPAGVSSFLTDFAAAAYYDERGDVSIKEEGM